MFDIVEVLNIEPPYKFLQLVLLRLHWHFLQDEGSLGQHSYSFK